jgi:regulatory protein
MTVVSPVDVGGGHDSLAPVTPLFGGSSPATLAPGALQPEAPASAARESGWHRTWTPDRRARDLDDISAAAVELAEKALLKRLRTRSLSVAEARAVLRDHELEDAAAEQILASMEEYGYLDDAALAEQIVHTCVERKGHGRQLIAQALAKRGIPREVADASLAALPDDDFERALEFARAKARSLRSLDRDTALRRLTGQLGRRGYGGSLALTAARTALDERPAGSTGVRFV